MSIKILTANDLHSGGVIFATSEGNWSSFITQAQLSSDSQTEETLVSMGNQSVEAQTIVDPFLIDINIINGVPVPKRYREQLRVSGPSVRTDFSKPALREVA